jgi:hypothetical protein
MTIQFVKDEISESLRRLDSKSKTIAQEAVSACLAEAEKDAKRNAPWTDRTGNARRSITGTRAVVEGHEAYGYLYIGVYYGVFLELCNQGRFRIIFPTLEIAATKLPQWVRWSYARHK